MQATWFCDLTVSNAQRDTSAGNQYFFTPGVVVADKCPLLLGKEGSRILAVEDPEMGEEATAAALIERPSLALLLKKTPEKEGCVIGMYINTTEIINWIIWSTYCCRCRI